MSLPARKPSSPLRPPEPAKAPNPDAPRVVKFEKGDLIFGEGESSRSMYYVKSGIIRIFKKKGNAKIEVTTINSGQVLGELAFLDGMPRSASAEALTQCTLVEISGSTFTNTISKMPDWLKLLLKTIVGRLRAASTRIRQLEQASTAFDYSSKDGKRSAHYVYLSAHDVLKISAAILLVASRNGQKNDKGQTVRAGLLTRYANQIMGIPVAKITTLLDVYSSVGIVSGAGADDSEKTEVTLIDADTLEQYIAYVNEENLVEPSKRHDISVKGFLIMSLMAKYMHQFTDMVGEATRVNLAEIVSSEMALSGKEPFRMDEFPELVNLGYCTNLEVKANDKLYTLVKKEAFLKHFRFQRIQKAIEAVNNEKS